MVVINDSADVEYTIDHSKVRVINLGSRFESIAEKIRYGYQQCKYDHVYRLDDDDLLAPWALRNTAEDIEANPGYEIYRSNGHYFFLDNRYLSTADNINNGNVYSKKYLDRIPFPRKSIGEDVDITLNHGAKIFTSSRAQKTMIYRWGMNTYHISGWGETPPDIINSNVDNLISRNTKEGKSFGIIKLSPAFKEDYFSKIQ